MVAALFSILIGYVLGSVPFGLILNRLVGGPDLRSIGSGSIGATNVLRTGKKSIALLTVLLDGLKGAAAGWIALSLFGAPMQFVAAAAALFGHCFPIWLRFRGGKGVATFFGSLFGLVWPLGLVAAATWLTVAFTTRYSSAAGLSAAAFTTAVSLILFPLPVKLMLLAMTALIVFRHKDNIFRLKSGTESRIGGSIKDAES